MMTFMFQSFRFKETALMPTGYASRQHQSAARCGNDEETPPGSCTPAVESAVMTARV
jgi:hypothetical protein